ncbi:hypothetical protein FHP29_03015 [Nocardioides albidus]|uniref:ATP synthase protein I n=1 Tax=Nocardioides albidus TaxID=1517589 RepID=A0A5C4WIH0_9ACTN|nr:hypothetical protein [Nocardioides albidus]TNM47159.1 hypothetical protein FHP29_03015 [Nocardioides albidus]
MLTTETRTHRVVMRAALVAAVAAVLLVLVAALVAGSAAALGAAVGGVVAVGVFAFGSLSVELVARLMPAASLLFALLTYTLQVVLMALVFVALNRSGLLGEELDGTWVGVAIILGAFVWMTAQILLATTARIPAFEPRASSPAEGGAR